MPYQSSEQIPLVPGASIDSSFHVTASTDRLPSFSWTRLTLTVCFLGFCGLMAASHRDAFSNVIDILQPPQQAEALDLTMLQQSKHEPKTSISIAFLGNSMIYFNDFPRFFQQLADVDVQQDSCLHGGASIPSLVLQGNGMYPQFMTPQAEMGSYENATIYDYGRCTVEALLLGFDVAIFEIDFLVQPDPNNETRNPCHVEQNYLDYSIHRQETDIQRPHWDFVVMNDNTRNPARRSTREASLETLTEKYIPWFLASGATPVFLWTQAYTIESTEQRNMTGLEDVANFTSLTGAGYREYAKLLAQYLPPHQAPRIAPVGLGYLLIHEENPDLWLKLFHCDHLHASPLGTFLQGCIIHHTITGALPSLDGINNEDDIVALWKTARMMQHAWEPPNPFPTYEELIYLYSIAERITSGYLPTTYIDYENGEVADQKE